MTAEKKPIAEEHKRPKKGSSSRVVEEKSPSDSIKLDQQVWQEEVNAIQQQRFGSLEEAVDYLIVRITSRLGLRESETEQQRDFLKLFIETDPVFVEHLQKLVR